MNIDESVLNNSIMFNKITRFESDLEKAHGVLDKAMLEDVIKWTVVEEWPSREVAGKHV